MKKRFSILFCLIITFAWAQEASVLSGEIINKNGKRVTIEYARDLFGLVKETSTNELNADNLFSFALKLRYPTYVTLIHEQATYKIYLQPGRHVHVTFDYNNISKSITFTGTGAEYNSFFAQFNEVFKIKADEKKIFWDSKNETYQTDVNTAAYIKSHSPFDYVTYLDKIKSEELKFLDSYNNLNPLTNKEYNNIQTYIESIWLKKMLEYEIYHDYFDILHEVIIPKGFDSYLKEFNFRDTTRLDNPAFCDAISTYGQYLKFKAKKDGGFYNEVDFSNKDLPITIKSYLYARLMQQWIDEGNIDKAQLNYGSFMYNCKINELRKSIESLIMKKANFIVGSPAPHFSAEDATMQTFYLDQTQGKVVVIDFWASWCGPCIDQITRQSYARQQLMSKGVEFIFISLDKDKDTWKRAIRNYSINGKHVFAEGGINGSIPKQYSVKSLPASYVVDKYGLFASFKNETFQQDIEKLLVQ